MTINYKLLSRVVLPAAVFASLFIGGSSASAASLNYTNHPMDDSTFRASFTMTPTDIQNFLVNKGSGLANFTDIEDCGSAGGAHYSFYATYYHCGTRQVAAQIIYDASQAYGINPQAIIATMQKEQSLITTPNPAASQLNYAMGYGCPDSGGCSYAGFFNQVDNGTWQFRTDYELSSGNNYWGYTPSSYPCNGATRYYSNALRPGNSVTFIDDHGTGYASFVIPNASTATLYCYTPHVFPGSAQEYYSGSYWFVYYYSQWFGGGIAPFAFKSPSDPTIYLFVNGFKVIVPAMGILQDYGVSPASIQTISQDKVNAIPTPNLATDGISPYLSYITKSYSDTDADGGSLYLVTIDNKYSFKTMQQFADYNFDQANIGYLPLSFIQTINGNSQVSNYISTPTSAAFQISGGQKRIIFSYQTYLNLNPSNQATPVSYFIANLVPSGNPLTDQPALVKYSSGDTVYLYTNGTYYSIPTLDTYNCWGFDATLHTPVYGVYDNSYLAPITPASSLSCLIKDGSGTNYLLSRNSKYTIPPSFGLSASQTTVQDLLTVANSLPTISSPINQYIRGKVSPAVWFIESGSKKPVPSYSNFVLLNVSSTQLSYIDDSALSTIPSSLVPKLGTGQVVKTQNSAEVYVISGSSRVLYSTSDNFLAYGNNWADIESYPQAMLDQNYPYANQSVSRYFYDQPSDSLYLVDPNGCYKLSAGLQTSYSQSQSSIAGTQSYQSSVFPRLNLSTCKNGSVYVKQPGQATVYWVDGGAKHPIDGWNVLVQKSGSNNPYIINLSTSLLQTLPTGSDLTN